MKSIKNILGGMFLVFLVFACSPQSSESNEMKTSYVNQCTESGATKSICECIFEYGKENLSAELFMESDLLTSEYKKKNNITTPGISTMEQFQKLTANTADAINQCF